MPPAEALHAGSSATWLPSENRLHDFYGFGWVQTFIGDVRYAVLSLGRNPAVSLATALEGDGVGLDAAAGGRWRSSAAKAPPWRGSAGQRNPPVIRPKPERQAAATRGRCGFRNGGT